MAAVWTDEIFATAGICCMRLSQERVTCGYGGGVHKNLNLRTQAARPETTIAPTTKIANRLVISPMSCKCISCIYESQ